MSNRESKAGFFSSLSALKKAKSGTSQTDSPLSPASQLEEFSTASLTVGPIESKLEESAVLKPSCISFILDSVPLDRIS